MWCHRCKLDVPTRQQPPEAVLRCGVCAAILPGATIPDGDEPAEIAEAEEQRHNAAEECSACEEAGPAEPPRMLRFHDPCPDLYDEQLDDELAEVRRLIRRTSHLIVSPWDADDAFSLADCLTADAVSTSAAETAAANKPAEAAMPQTGRWWAVGGWLLVCIGAMGLVFASVLFTATEMGTKGSEPVWPLCLLSAFAGQFLVVLGFMLRHGSGRDAAIKPTKETPTVEKVAPAAPVPAVHTSPRPHAAHRPPWSETVERALATSIDSDR